MDLFDLTDDNMEIEKDEKEKDFSMSKEKNLFLAKKYMVESVYRSANIEGIGITFPETQTICDGMSISGYSIDEINAVNDLKNAWRWVFDNIDHDIDINLLCNINKIAGKYTVSNSGTFRTIYDEPIRVPVHNGKNYYPEVPDVNIVTKEFEEISKGKDLDSSLELFCYICKKQLFNDGNKRTATICTNVHMIQNGLGILSIPVNKKLEFYNALASFYEDDSNKKELKLFLEQNCITR